MNLEEIKKKKLKELQKSNQSQNEEDLSQLDLEKAKKNLINEFLSKEAIERLGRVRLAHPHLAQQAELVILQAARTGKLSKLKDKDLKTILNELNFGKKQFRFIK